MQRHKRGYGRPDDAAKTEERNKAMGVQARSKMRNEAAATSSSSMQQCQQEAAAAARSSK